MVDYRRISSPDGPLITGFIAQEVLEAYPQMVTTGPDGLLGIRETALIPVLTKAVQEQQLQINALSSSVQQPILQENYQQTTLDTVSNLTILNLLETKSDFLAYGIAQFKNTAIFSGLARFLGPVEFAQAPTFSNNMAGKATILAGGTSVYVPFTPTFGS